MELAIVIVHIFYLELSGVFFNWYCIHFVYRRHMHERSKVTPNPWSRTCKTLTTEQNNKAVRPQADLGPDTLLSGFPLQSAFTFWVKHRVSHTKQYIPMLVTGPVSSLEDQVK